jgi:hypothetical protein
MSTFEVKRGELRAVRHVDEPTPEIGDGEALLRIDRFSVTSNNVTYAAFGDGMRYWDFFPAADEGWGRVPVWGHADVVASNVDALPEGTRVYGYLQMAPHLVVRPEHVTPNGFVDASAHRASLPPVYNQYQRVPSDGDTERETAILRPLFTTSFLLDDWLADDDLFGATSVILGSASSKTALGLAFLLSQRDGIEVIGLTSPRNEAFVQGVGYYDGALRYDSIDDLDPGAPSVFVDMGGSAPARVALHSRLGYSLKASCMVGATHWEDPPDARELPGPQPSFFFAPDRVVKRREDWGAAGFDERVESAWDAFLASVAAWLQVVERHGGEELEQTWLEVLEGGAPPEVGYVVSPAD